MSCKFLSDQQIVDFNSSKVVIGQGYKSSCHANQTTAKFPKIPKSTSILLKFQTQYYEKYEQEWLSDFPITWPTVERIFLNFSLTSVTLKSVSVWRHYQRQQTALTNFQRQLDNNKSKEDFLFNVNFNSVLLGRSQLLTASSSVSRSR